MNRPSPVRSRTRAPTRVREPAGRGYTLSRDAWIDYAIRVKTGIRGPSSSGRQNRLIVVALFAGLAVSTVRADTFRCGTGLVRPGDTSFEVLKKCGPPASQQQISGANERFVEQWYYEPGPREFTTHPDLHGDPAGQHRNRDPALARISHHRIGNGRGDSSPRPKIARSGDDCLRDHARGITSSGITA